MYQQFCASECILRGLLAGDGADHGGPLRRAAAWRPRAARAGGDHADAVPCLAALDLNGKANSAQPRPAPPQPPRPDRDESVSWRSDRAAAPCGLAGQTGQASQALSRRRTVLFQRCGAGGEGALRFERDPGPIISPEGRGEGRPVFGQTRATALRLVTALLNSPPLPAPPPLQSLSSQSPLQD